jgi:hypothetical protein
VGGFLIVLAAPFGIVFGMIARSRIRHSEEPVKGSGLAAVGIVVGIVAIATWCGIIAVASTRSTTRSVPAVMSPDLALAHRGLLVHSEYPTGWQGQGGGTEVTDASAFDGLSSAEVAAMEACIGISSVGVDTAPVEAASQEYSDPNSNLDVNDTVDVFPTTAAAAVDISAESTSRFPVCQLPILNPPSQFVTGWYDVGNGKIDAGPISVIDRPIASTGARAVDLEISDTFRVTKGSSGVVHVDEIAVQRGRSESNLLITNLDGPIPISLVERMARAASTQLKK